MKSKSLYLLVAFISVHAAHLSYSQQQWIPFNNNSNPSGAIIQLTHSSAQYVSWSVSVSGVFKRDTAINNVVYSRLSLPQAGKTGMTGYPELPIISKSIATPRCDGVELTFFYDGFGDF
jgi:hypothetical protein